MYRSTGVSLQAETRHLIMLSQMTFSEVDKTDIDDNLRAGIIQLITRYCAPDIQIFVYDVLPRTYGAKDALSLARWYVNMKTRAARWN